MRGKIKHLSILAGALLLLGLSSSAVAQESKKMPPEKMMQHHGMMMSVMDTNQDGKISKDEYLKEHEKKFDAFDKNGDGLLEKNEHEAFMTEKHKWMMKTKDKDMVQPGTGKMEGAMKKGGEAVTESQGLIEEAQATPTM